MEGFSSPAGAGGDDDAAGDLLQLFFLVFYFVFQVFCFFQLIFNFSEHSYIQYAPFS